MKNFARLARFAWPYRVRFAVSLGCAVMVAALWFTNIGAVYPLLKILFYSQNAQVWVDEQIDSTESSIAARRARLGVMDDVERWDALGEKGHALIRESHEKAANEAARAARVLAEKKKELGDLNAKPLNQAKGLDALALTQVRRDDAIADARLDELGKATVRLVHASDAAGFNQRRASLRRDLARDMSWLGRYHRISPFIHRYLPDDSFRTLLLLIGIVMAGVAVKGLFQFFQEVLVADITQLSLFDIRNLFFRRTMALDLASFSDQGSAELMSRFTSDMDSVAQGFNTVLSKVIREPLRIVTCLGGALWLNWRLTCLALVLVPVSAYCTMRAGKIMKRAVRRSLESMSNIYKILQESFQGIKVVKAFTMERYERQTVLPGNEEPLQKEREGRQDRRAFRPRTRGSRAFDGDDRAPGRLLPRAAEDDLPEHRFPAPARLDSHGDRGPADALRDVGGDLRPHPQAGERSLEGPARRCRLGSNLPTDGPRAGRGR